MIWERWSWVLWEESQSLVGKFGFTDPSAPWTSVSSSMQWEGKERQELFLGLEKQEMAWRVQKKLSPQSSL